MEQDMTHTQQQKKPHFLTREQWLENKRNWAAYIANRIEGYNYAHLLRAILVGTDPFAAFPPITRSEKIPTGHHKYYALDSALNTLLNMLEKIQLCEQSEEHRKWYRISDPSKIEIGPLTLHTNSELTNNLILFLKDLRSRIPKEQ